MNKKRYIKKKIVTRKNRNSYIQSQTTRKLSLFYGDKRRTRLILLIISRFLFVATLTSIFYLFSFFLGLENEFQILINKIGFSCANGLIRSFFRTLGWDVGPILGFVIIALLSGSIGHLGMTLHMMQPAGGDSGSNSGDWRQYLNSSSDKEGNAESELSTGQTPGHPNEVDNGATSRSTPVIEQGGPSNDGSAAQDRGKDIDQILLQKDLALIEAQKQKLATKLVRLIKEEAARLELDMHRLPSSTDLVNPLIHKIGTPLVKDALESPSKKNVLALKKWLTRACNNADDSSQSALPLRSGLKDLLLKYKDEGIE